MMKRFIFSILAIFLCLCVLEGALTVVEFRLKKPQHVLNQIQPEDKDRLRVLTIGESTTADYCAGTIDLQKCKSWPRQLEKLLRDHGVNARIYNEGHPGTSAPFILSRLPSWIERYKPHIVVSMVGVNDASLRPTYNRESFFSSLHIVRIVMWAFNTVLGPKVNDLQHEWDPQVGVISQMVPKLPMRRWDTEVPQLIKDLPDHQKGLIWGLFADACEEHWRHGKTDGPTCLAYAERAYQLAPNDRSVIGFLISILIRMDKFERIDQVASDILRKRLRMTDEILSQFMSVHEMQSPNAWKVLQHFGYERVNGPDTPEEVLSMRLQRMHEILEEAGMIHLRMQYPTLRVEDLAARYRVQDTDLDELGFIENRNNFAEALARHPFEEIFRDRIEDSWGHTTTLGSSLIAKQVNQKILDIAHNRILRGKLRWSGL